MRPNSPGEQVSRIKRNETKKRRSERETRQKFRGIRPSEDVAQTIPPWPNAWRSQRKQCADGSARCVTGVGESESGAPVSVAGEVSPGQQDFTADSSPITDGNHSAWFAGLGPQSYRPAPTGAADAPLPRVGSDSLCTPPKKIVSSSFSRTCRNVVSSFSGGQGFFKEACTRM